MLMTDTQIIEAVKSGTLLIPDFEKYQKESLQPASYDLHLGPQAFSSRRREIMDISREGVLILEPGEFGIVLSHKKLELPPDIAGHFGLRSYFSRKGMTVFGGIQVDPGFRGRLKIGLYNLSPKDVALTYLEPFCTIEFYRLSQPVTQPYKGPYQDEDSITSKDLAPVLEASGMTFGEVLKSLGTLSQQMSNNTSAIENLSREFKFAMAVYGAGLVFIGIMIAVR
jgi:dCTP deaminase